MDKTIDEVVTPEGDQDQELEINLDGEGESTDLKELVAKEREAKKQILARAKKAEEELKSLKNQTKSEEKPAEVPKPKYDLDEVTDLRLDGFTRDEVAFIMNNGGRKSLTDNPFVKVAIEQMREQKKAEQAIPSQDTGKSEIERKYTKEQLSKMSADELYKILPKSNR